MKTKTIAAVVALFVTGICFGQYDGDALSSYISKSSESAEVKAFIDNYHCDTGNPNHCTSTEGVELMLQKGVITEVRLYQLSKVFGSFKGKLPKGLHFGMTSSEAKELLGKPTLSYNSSGYSEFDMSTYTLSCWFEGGKLTQVTITAKA